jgi:hypothetical protein
MGIATSIVLFAIGAVLDFAVKVHTTGFNIHTIGVILMVVGGIGFLVSLAFWSSWGGFGGVSRSRRVYEETPGGRVVDETHSSGAF